MSCRRVKSMNNVGRSTLSISKRDSVGPEVARHPKKVA